MTARRSDRDDSFVCPHCGADVPSGARFCRECGASEESGWSSSADGTDEGGGYGEDDFDYEEFVRREFPDRTERAPPSATRMVAAAIAILVAVAIVWSMLRP